LRRDLGLDEQWVQMMIWGWYDPIGRRIPILTEDQQIRVQDGLLPESDKEKTEEDKNAEDKTEGNKTEENKAEENKAEENKAEENKAEKDEEMQEGEVRNGGKVKAAAEEKVGLKTLALKMLQDVNSAA